MYIHPVMLACFLCIIPVSSTNKTNLNDISETFLKVALNTYSLGTYISIKSGNIRPVLLVIGVSGVVMTFTSNHTDVIMVKHFASGLLSFDWGNG
jgi:hypothetical protein